MATDSRSFQRRQLLRMAANAGLLTLCRPLLAASTSSNESPQAQYLTARQRDGRFEAVLLDADGRDLKVVALPDRGHSFAIDHAGRRAVAFGRQPGFFALAFGLDDDLPPQPLALPADRHFFGHGCFSADGNRLFATENDFDGERGVLGIYDATPGGGWRRLGEFDSGGIGPHEILSMPDGRTLCVANGGILTHPDYGKRELNLDSMRPSLAYLDAADGRLLERHEPPAQLHQLSIRHLALGGDGTVWFGCQYSGPLSDKPALVGRHKRGDGEKRSTGENLGEEQRRGSQLEWFAAPDPVQHALRGYIGSISADDGGDVIATSSPVGGLTCYWRAADGAFLGSTERPDGCGVAPAGTGRFLLSDGFGAIVRGGPGHAPSPLLDSDGATAWDNHFRKV